MKRAWHPEELAEHWTIVPGEWPLIEHKYGATRLGFAVIVIGWSGPGNFMILSLFFGQPASGRDRISRCQTLGAGI